LVAGLGRHVINVKMLRLYAVACVLMGAFSTLYNYVGYRLVAPPFSLAPGVVGLVFLAYLAGTASSAVAGRLAERAGPRLVLVAGAAICMAAAVVTLPNSLAAILCGVLMLTVGFFAAHSVASGWVGRLATSARAQASALYTLSYYVGASVGGWAGGVVYERRGWLGVVAYLQVLLALAIVAGVSIAPPARRPAGSGNGDRVQQERRV
jgi:YNFM family putative membrane transporter